MKTVEEGNYFKCSIFAKIKGYYFYLNCCRFSIKVKATEKSRKHSRNIKKNVVDSYVFGAF